MPVLCTSCGCRGSEAFNYSYFTDTSQPFPLLFFNVSKLHNHKRLHFGDDRSSEEFDRQYLAFQQAHRWRDEHFDHGWDWKLKGLETHLLAFVDLAKKSMFMDVCWYLLSVLTFFTWPYRLWMEGECVRVSFTYEKVVWCN